MAKARKKLSGKALKAALKKIRVLIFDIDGILTDGKIFYTEGTGWGAHYSVIDGYGIRRLMKAGVPCAFISGGSFLSHKKRAEVLKIEHAYFGNEDKIGAYEKIKSDLGLKDEQCAYIADELFDIPVLERVGFAATVDHAPKEVKNVAHYITKRPGGNGAAREITDMLFELQEANK